MTVAYLDKQDTYLVTCERRLCYLHICTNTLDLAANLETNHKCPEPGGETHYSWEVTMTLVEKMWEMIDSEYLALVEILRTDLSESRDAENQKGKLRGYAECLALFMSPHFRDADEVAREVMQRAKGDPDYETPGIGSRRFEMPRYEPSAAHKETQSKRFSIQEVNARGVAATHATPKAKSVVGVKITADAATVQAIKDLGDFAEPADLAGIYGITVEEVAAILLK